MFVEAHELNTCIMSLATFCSGDAAQHLMWRLRHGEGLVSAGPQLAVIMIGSSDLTYASLMVVPPPLPPHPPLPIPPRQVGAPTWSLIGL